MDYAVYLNKHIGILGEDKGGCMKISTKGRYGLRAMLDLAVYAKGDHVALGSIAERQNISMNYLEQVFATLRKAGLVKSIKGAQGGYILAYDPSEITVGSVLRVLEGNLSVIDEAAYSNLSPNSIQYCIKLHVWEKMNDSLNQVVDGITLENLVENYKKLNGQSSMMYYI